MTRGGPYLQIRLTKRCRGLKPLGLKRYVKLDATSRLSGLRLCLKKFLLLHWVDMAALVPSGQREPHGLQFSLPSSTMDCRIIHCRITVVDSDLKKMKSFIIIIIIIIIDSSSSPRFKAKHLHLGQVSYFSTFRVHQHAMVGPCFRGFLDSPI